jgi:serine/threonine-protein kinase
MPGCGPRCATIGVVDAQCVRFAARLSPVRRSDVVVEPRRAGHGAERSLLCKRVERSVESTFSVLEPGGEAPPREQNARFTMASVPLDTVASRTFLQQRLETLLAMICVFVPCFFGLGPVLGRLLGSPTAVSMPHWQMLLLNAPLPLVLLGTWIYLRRASPASAELALIDAGVTVGCGAAFSVMMYFTDARDRTEFDYLLATTHVLVARAALIPSTTPRTVTLGAFATLPLVLVVFDVHERTGVLDYLPSPLLSMGVAASWAALAVASSWVVSRVVYGLREKVRQAMQLGQYTVQEKLGEGGMGIVFKASHAMLRRPTAIKLLPPEKAGVESLARFEKEVQLTATLTHPNTIAVYDYGKTPDGVLYYAMEYIDGISLQQLVERDGPLPPGRVIHLLRQVCGALFEAHCAGLVHRDVKPANILLCHRAQVADMVKVVDFGLVKQIGAPVSMSQPSSNTVTGTPLYISPEAIVAPETVGAAADLYAVGAVGYYLLTGTPVFHGRSAIELCTHHLHTTPEPMGERLRAAVPVDLEGVISRCLAKAPADRPTDAHHLADMLAACADAASWTETDATRWWQTHVLPRKPLKAPAPATAARTDVRFTVPIDIRDREGSHAA